MRLTQALTWFGREISLDLYFGPTTVDDEPEPEPEPDRRGDALSTPIGFTRPEIPWDADCPVHQFDPGEDAEDV